MPPDGGDDALAAKLAFLREPGNYPDSPARVEAIETHFSWVFLTPRYAYKLKKPVAEELIDWRTLTARRRNCDEEARVNRRFAPGIYLGVVALARDRTGALHLEGEGTPVEWLVKMHCLPADTMLDRIIAAGRFDAAQLLPIVDLVCSVYRQASAPMTGAAYATRLSRIIDTSRAQLCQPQFGLPVAQIESLAGAQQSLLATQRPVFDSRGARVVEGHGDLRPEHVCLGETPLVIDSLEFARDLRLIDPVDELGFLALECERLGAPAARVTILAEYARRSGDDAPPWLVDFYQGMRACVRARLAIRHLLEPAPRDAARWPRLAAAYLDLASRHVQAATR